MANQVVGGVSLHFSTGYHFSHNHVKREFMHIYLPVWPQYWHHWVYTRLPLPSWNSHWWWRHLLFLLLTLCFPHAFLLWQLPQISPWRLTCTILPLVPFFALPQFLFPPPSFIFSAYKVCLLLKIFLDDHTMSVAKSSNFSVALLWGDRMLSLDLEQCWSPILC